MKWFPLAVIGLLAQFVLSQDSVEASRWVVDIFHGFALLAVFASIAVPVLRYRLYDIDRFVSRTVTYSIVVGVLGGSVSLLATVVSVQFFEDPLVVAATTLTVAAVFNPLRRRVQRVVDRRFNRSRYDAERIMDDFAGTLQGEVDPGLVVDGWVIVVKETMEPATVGVWVR